MKRSPVRHTTPTPHSRCLYRILGYSDYLGRLAVGKIFNGTARSRDSLVCMGENGRNMPLKSVQAPGSYDGMTLKDVDDVQPGDIAVLAGIEDVKIGDTICNREAPEASAPNQR